MSEKVRDYLGIAIIIGILGVAYAAASAARSYGNSIDPSRIRSFSVTAQGKAVSVPDVGSFRFTVLTEGGKDLGKLQKENNEKMKKAIDYLKSQGVEEKDIKTVNYVVNPRYSNYNCYPQAVPMYETMIYPERPVPSPIQKCPPPEIVGYSISQDVEVKIRNLDKAGDLLGGVVNTGANIVSDLEFKVDDPTAVENEAREEAMRKGREKAEKIAEAGGFKLGRLISIYEGGYYPPYYAKEIDYGYGYGGDGGGVPVPVEPGSQEVNISVTLAYEIR